jgi:addiction module RelE/StbE family toxin
VKLEWSIFAFVDRDRIFDHIELDSPHTAAAVDDAIADRALQLIRYPESGRLGRIEGTRELVVTNLPYILAYRIKGDTVRILRVLHSAQQWPSEMSQ